jgi:hypothetical protein
VTLRATHPGTRCTRTVSTKPIVSQSTGTHVIRARIETRAVGKLFVVSGLSSVSAGFG